MPVVGTINLSYLTPHEDILLLEGDSPKEIIEQMIELMNENLKRLKVLKELEIEKIEGVNIHFSSEEDYDKAFDAIAINEYDSSEEDVAYDIHSDDEDDREMSEKLSEISLKIANIEKEDDHVFSS